MDTKDLIKNSLRHISECPTCTSEIQENAVELCEGVLQVVQCLVEMNEGVDEEARFHIPEESDIEDICILVSYLNHIGKSQKSCSTFLQVSIQNMLISTTNKGLPEA